MERLEKTLEECKFKGTDNRVCEYTKTNNYVSCGFISQDGICQYKDKVEVVLGTPKIPSYDAWKIVADEKNRQIGRTIQ